AFNNADLKDQFELKEILDPPAPAEMYTRFKVEDISSFPASEQERIREAFYRFKSIGSSDIDVDDLEKTLIHLGYLKIDAQVIMEITQKLTKFATLDYEEYLRFVGQYTSFERAEVQRVFREFDEDGSGSLDTEEIEGVMRSFSITPFKATVEAAIAVVDEDHTGTVEFHEFVHLLTVYKKTEGFSQAEVKDLYAVFYKFAVPVSDSKLREVPESEMRNALMNLFGPQTLSVGVKLVNEVLVKIQKKKEEKAAKRALSRQQGGPEQGMKFREFLVWARCLREAEITAYRRKFDKVDYTKSGLLMQDNLKEALHHIGYTALRPEVEDLLERRKVSKDDMIDFECFVNLVQDFCRTDGFSRRDVDEFFEVFRAFDAEGSGEVGVLEVASMLRWLGFSIELDVANSYFQSVNLDGADRMGFAEFLRLMRLHRDDCLGHMQEVFDRNCEQELVLKQDCLKQVLTQMDRRVSVNVISQCLQGVRDARYIDFDDFVQVTDNMRRHILNQMRKQAGFTDDEVRTFQQAFEKYDTDGNRKLTRDEMPPLLADLKIDLRTVDDQRHFVRVLEEARLSARRGGASEDEVGIPGAPGITFWNFVHFLRVLQTEEDIKTVQSQAVSHLFSEKEQDELRAVFNTWCTLSADAQNAEADSDIEGIAEPSLERNSSEVVVASGLKLPFKRLWKLLRELGVPLTPTHVKLLKARAALDAENALPVEQRGSYIDSSGFLRLLSWMLDADFAGIRERSEELAENPYPEEG
ncbi:CALM1, partial [Symbiodinium sp. CCMP2456]